MIHTDLIERIRQLSYKLEPMPCPVDPTIHDLKQFRILIFDIYGTLFISNAGDIAAHQQKHAELIQKSFHEFDTMLESSEAKEISAALQVLIEQEHQRKRSANIHPEIDIVALWNEILQTEILRSRSKTLDPQSVAIEFELRSNPVWPMPGLESILSAVKSMPWGIVSNAQFYTQLLFPAFFGKTVAELGCRSATWSYELGIAKPTVSIFEQTVNFYKQEYHIDASELLYVGNDMRNDVLAASSAGLQTALFAGDRRSLRLREDDPCCRNVQPSCIITELEQLKDLISQYCVYSAY